MKATGHKRPRNLLPKCCVSRLGQVKRAYDSEEEANEAARKAEEQRGEALEAYPCKARPGMWHIRKRKGGPMRPGRVGVA